MSPFLFNSNVDIVYQIQISDEIDSNYKDPLGSRLTSH